MVDTEGRATIQLPAEVHPGPHHVVMILDEMGEPDHPFRVENLPRHDIPWPFGPKATFRREDLYGDDGR